MLLFEPVVLLGGPVADGIKEIWRFLEAQL
jgi:hypothetical protein